MKISPFAPKSAPSLPPIAGVHLSACEAGLKYKNRKDLMVALFEPGTVAAGALTKSKTASAAVEWCRAQLQHHKASALIVNAGNANAFTGMRGQQAVIETADGLAGHVDCEPSEIYVASTGVIGEPLNPDDFKNHLADLVKTASPESWQAAADAIMTTDTYPKLATTKTEINGQAITINGIAKGSGMIAPDMATMLAFLFTDASIAPPALQDILNHCLDETFNAITVDSDTSTSDTVLLFATGAACHPQRPQITDPADPQLDGFKKALHTLMTDLALQIVKDGEGISKFITVDVEGAECNASAKQIALSIANSPLVKTAIAGEDANWGRIVMAVGKSGEAADRDRLSIWFGPLRVAFNGERDTNYSEDDALAYMKNDDILIKVDVGVGKGNARIWTCDLTHDYISINADYRS